jgi:gas vesicle protein
MSDRPVVVDADEITHNEDLPYPVVAYPSHYGTFIGFKRDPDDDLYFCSCAREAIENYVDCQYEYLQGSHRDATPQNILNSDFPEETKSIIHHAGINDVHNIVDALLFEEGLCHKCNAVVPRRRYCHEMYGTVFRQNYGWYVFQKYYEYGICKPKSQTLLVDTDFEKLPGEIIDVVDDELIEDIVETATRFKVLRQKRRERDREINAAKKEEMRELREEFGDERGCELYYQRIEEIREEYESKTPLKPEEQDELEALREKLSENSARVSDTVENEVRKAVGHYKKGNRWTSETILYQLIKSRYGDEFTIERHYRPDWLDGLELDVFLVEPDVGIEYQGVQHYETVDHWGGEEGLRKRQARDKRTRELCREHNVELVEIRHDEELSAALVASKLDPVVN